MIRYFVVLPGRQMSVAGEGAARTAAMASFPPVSVTELRVDGGPEHGSIR